MPMKPPASRRLHPPRHPLAATLLEAGQGLSFFVSLFLLLTVASAAFLTPTLRWRERLALMLTRTLLALLVCWLSGMLFNAPVRGNGEAGVRVLRTLPVQLFLWTIPAIAVLSAVHWYFLCGCPAWSAAHYFACR